MTGIEIFTLVVLALFIVVGVAYQYQKRKDSIQDIENIEVKAEQVIDELYNKDLRPIVAKKTPRTPKVEATTEEVKQESKPEFPIDKPKKKRKYYPRKKK
jgi:hypothetical protein